jgi:hypothetical protein
LQLGDRIVAADHTDDSDRTEQRSRGAEIHRGAAQGVGDLTEGSGDRVQRDTANDEQAHITSDPVR